MKTDFLIVGAVAGLFFSVGFLVGEQKGEKLASQKSYCEAVKKYNVWEYIDRNKIWLADKHFIELAGLDSYPAYPSFCEYPAEALGLGGQ